MQLITKQEGIYTYEIPANSINIYNQILQRFRFIAGLPSEGIERMMIANNHADTWHSMMKDELKKKKYQDQWIRINGAGEFFSEAYTRSWMRICSDLPAVNFYAFTQKISMMKRLDREGIIPANFIPIYIYGGKENHLIRLQEDRHARAFSSREEIIEANYVDISDDNSMAAYSSNHRIGIIISKG